MHMNELNCSCQAYKLHLEGKIHKKKEASVGIKGGSAYATQQFGRSGHFCEVCDVACSSKDAYDAHVRGTKHQKVRLSRVFVMYCLHFRLDSECKIIRTKYCWLQKCVLVATLIGWIVSKQVNILFIKSHKLTQWSAKAESEARRLGKRLSGIDGRMLGKIFVVKTVYCLL